MFAEFSRGYYLGRLYVAPRGGGRAVLQRDLHERVNEQLYADEGVSRLDAPLVMKVDNRHIVVHGAPDVPGDTLELPVDLLEDVDVENPPSLQEVLLAKADRAHQLLELTGSVTGAPGI